MDGNEEKIVQSESGGEETTGAEQQATEQVDQQASRDNQSSVEWKEKYETLLKRVEGAEKANSAFQREKDLSVKSAKEWEQKYRTLEKSLKSVRGRFGDDSDVTSALDNELTQSELEFYRTREAEEKQRLKEQQEAQTLGIQMKQVIVSMGVDPNHPDFHAIASTAKNPLDFQIRMLAKANELKQNGGKTVLKDEIAQIREEVKAELRREMGLDSSDNIPPVGSSGKVYTAAGIAKMSLEEFNKEEAEINKAMAEGRIK